MNIIQKLPCHNFSVTLNLVLSSPPSFHHGEFLVWYKLLDVRHSSLPPHCHSISIIQDKKNLWDMDQAGVIRCMRGLPRQPDKPDASGWPGVISLWEHVVDVLVSLYLFFTCTPLAPSSSIFSFVLSFPWLLCTVMTNTEVHAGA